MAVQPDSRSTALRLSAFRPEWAPRIAEWCADPLEAYWLAPRTPPPITALRVMQWCIPGRNCYGLLDGRNALQAYGELNTLSGARREYWLGHLVVDPAQRGRGLGLRLTRALLHEAFQQFRARSVTLVVFRENEAAVRCYERAGMNLDGSETHYLAPYDRTETLLRMGITRSRWRRQAARDQI